MALLSHSFQSAKGSSTVFWRLELFTCYFKECEFSLLSADGKGNSLTTATWVKQMGLAEALLAAVKRREASEDVATGGFFEAIHEQCPQNNL